MPRSFLVQKDILATPTDTPMDAPTMLVVPDPRRYMTPDDLYKENKSPPSTDENSNNLGKMSPHAPTQQVKTYSKGYNLDYKRAPDTDTQHTPAEATAMINTPRAHERGGDPTKHSQTSPTGGAETPTKLFDPNPWQTALGYPGITPHFSQYLPLGLRLPGIPGIPPNFPMMSAADPLHMKAFSDPIMAYNSLRAFLPPHHFFPPPSFGFPLSPAISPFDKSMTPHLDSRLPSPHMEPKLSPSSLSLHGAKYSNTSSAFEPVISKYNLSPVSSNGELDLSLPSSTKRKLKEPEVTRYQCDGCNKSYSTYSGLSKHKQFHCTSQVQKEFSCKYCDKTYVSLGALKMHIRTHTLPCKCKLCGKAFSRPWLLQGHVRTHTGEKPFKCDHCGRAFADRSNLRAHLQTHSEVKKYSCKTCSKTFSRMSLLLKHEDGCTCGTPMMQ